MTHIAAPQIEQLAEMASPHYLAEGYHDDEHRQLVIDRAFSIGARAARSGLTFDPEILLLASSWHDAGIAINADDYLRLDEEGAQAVPFSEAVSAELFTREAERFGLDSKDIAHVREAILGTNPGVALPTTEAKLVAAADLYGVGFDEPDDFAATTRLLWSEMQWRSAGEIDWQQFIRGSVGYLGIFMDRDISLTPHYTDESGRSAWHTGAARNILGLITGNWGRSHVMVHYAGEAGVDKAQVQVAVADEEALNFGVPVHEGILSLPDESVDELTIGRSAILSRKQLDKLTRVLTEDGELIVE